MTHLSRLSKQDDMSSIQDTCLGISLRGGHHCKHSGFEEGGHVPKASHE